MAITPADIEQLTFSPSKRGYDTEEVDAFLEQLSGEVDAMLQKIADLKGRLNTSEQQLVASEAQVEQLQAQLSAAPQVSQATVADISAQPGTTASEKQISQVLIVAQQSADKIVAEARENADKIRTEADTKAREVIRQALAEKQNELDEIDRLKQSREQFRTDYKNLIQRFMDDADAAFPNQVLSTPTGSTGVSQAAPATPIPAAPAAPAPVANAIGEIDDLD
ncbi:MAG: DivIVA domain-containing protein [Atopobiaceae bacterium]|nr:DivIVA domain-containing protein [Atopobiaceae bacterium]